MPAKFDRRHFIAAGTSALAMPFVARGASAQGACIGPRGRSA